jgi:hypothetical protein
VQTKAQKIQAAAEQLQTAAEVAGRAAGMAPQEAAVVVLETALAIAYADAILYRGANLTPERRREGVRVMTRRSVEHLSLKIVEQVALRQGGQHKPGEPER